MISDETAALYAAIQSADVRTLAAAVYADLDYMRPTLTVIDGGRETTEPCGKLQLIS